MSHAISFVAKMMTASGTWPSDAGGSGTDGTAARASWRGSGTPHLSLVVPSPSGSADWWCRTFGFVPVGPPDSSWPTGPSSALIRHPETGLVVGFRQRPKDSGPARFEYLSLRVSSRRALDDWAAHLDRVGIARSPVTGDDEERYLSFIAPDGVGVELWWARPS